MKTEVYSWRLSTEKKVALERVARRRKASIASLLDEATTLLLQRESETERDDEAAQARLRASLMKFVGKVGGNDPTASRRVSEVMRERLQAKYRGR